MKTFGCNFACKVVEFDVFLTIPVVEHIVNW